MTLIELIQSLHEFPRFVVRPGVQFRLRSNHTFDPSDLSPGGYVESIVVTPSLLLLFLFVIALLLLLSHFCNCVIGACNHFFSCRNAELKGGDEQEESKRSCERCWRYVFVGLLLVVTCTGISGESVQNRE